MVYSPDPEDGERAVFHPQRQVNAISADSCTADRLLHVTASNQSMIYKAPYPLDTENRTDEDKKLQNIHIKNNILKGSIVSTSTKVFSVIM